MKIYAVGGYVRDTLLGKTPKDIDYVVVGSSPEEMISLGFVQVGADFPVFLKDGCEYALARTERKYKPGYHGFTVQASPDITLEEDLCRRDLTINSMAMDLETKQIIDPFDGQKDLKDRWLRHTSNAFKEDPVRILRTARFAARYGFDIHPDTKQFMHQMIANGEFDTLVPERVWAEIEKGLMEDNPENMFRALYYCGALSKIPQYMGGLHPYNVYYWIKQGENISLSVRFACISSGFGPEDIVYSNNRIPIGCARLASIMNKNYWLLCQYLDASPEDKLELLKSIGAIGSLRNSGVFQEVRQVYSYWYKDLVCNIAAIPDNLRIIDADAEALQAMDVQEMINQGILVNDKTIGNQIKLKQIQILQRNTHE